MYRDKIIIKYLRIFLYLILKIVFGLKVINRNILKSHNRSILFIANHTSHFDHVTSFVLENHIMNHTYYLGAKEYWLKGRLKNNKFLAWLAFNLLHAYFLDRNWHKTGVSNLTVPMNLSTWLLKKGNNLFIYPEGTRSITGKLQKFKVGTAMIALKAKSNIVPIFIAGTHKILPKGKSVPRLGEITITIGKPIIIDDFLKRHKQTKAFHLSKRLTEEMEQEYKDFFSIKKACQSSSLLNQHNNSNSSAQTPEIQPAQTPCK